MLACARPDDFFSADVSPFLSKYPEMALHGFQTALFLVTGHYWLFLFDLPVLVLHLRRCGV